MYPNRAFGESAPRQAPKPVAEERPAGFAGASLSAGQTLPRRNDLCRGDEVGDGRAVTEQYRKHE